MITRSRFPKLTNVPLLACALLALATSQAATIDIANVPLVTSAPSTVLPNLMFVMDDSGSMDWDYMPDWANDSLCRSAGATATSSGSFSMACAGQPPYKSSSFNGIYYNPAITYLPPLTATGSSYLSQTSGNTSGWTSVKNDAYNVQSTSSINLITGYSDVEYCVDTTYTDCLRNGNYVLPGTVNGKAYTSRRNTVATGSGYKAVGAPDAATTEAQEWGPHYYSMLPAEYCTSENLRNCQTTQTAAYNVPAPLRWCDSDSNARAATPAANSCQAAQTTTYRHPRYPTKFFTSGTTGSAEVPATRATVRIDFTVSNCSSGRQVAIESATVNGVNILSAPTALTNNRDTLGLRFAANLTGGYTANTSNGGERVTVSAPPGIDVNGVAIAMVATTASTCTFSPTTSATFGGYAPAVPAVPPTPAGWYGSFQRTDIVPSRTSYPKAGSRTDCAGATCTYDEEMTNFANWWTYYHTRMQAMKSATTLAFSPLSNQFRVGYMSINNNTGSDFHNPAQFETTEKAAWFNKLTKADPSSSTPLRRALSTVGRLYAGKLSSVNSVSAADPMQYSCQRNYTILSTDGYWNESTLPPDLSGTAVGDQDSDQGRPFFDGNSTSNTLADVAAYYYKTDLRTSGLGNCSGALGGDVCNNEVPADTVDTATHQHMTTFTIGLGASGFMQFRPDYATASSGDFFAVKNGSTAVPASGICTWQASGDCNWPAPAADAQTTIDDLWHAAVNGRGSYFSATDPASMYTGLSNALNSITGRSGAAAAATTSNPNVSAGDNFIFSSTFRSQDWTGQLQRRQIDVNTASISAALDWSAQSLLDANGSRTIYTYDASNATTHRKTFEWASLSTAEKAYFESTHMASSGAMSQFCSFGATCLSAAAQTDAAGEKLVDFLRGGRTNEGPLTDTTKYFRERVHVLGDIVNSEATYVKAPKFSYADSGYAAYQSAQSSRTGMVYVGANDGMLHAFNAGTGQESWAYVPSVLLPKLYKLADKDYANRHQYFVDGSPTVGDALIGGQWRTLLVAALGAGGRAYVALDVTDPVAPKVLWEFTDTNLGLTFGKPEITKLKDGTWVVLVTSGYNNVSPGDGRGRLYVLNATTGVVIRSIDTGAGSTTTPAGLAHIRAWVDSAAIDNTTLRVYGGDNLGNVWRFDINGDVGASGFDAQLLATLRDSSGNVQPVTARPEIASVNGNAVVYVGTGRYLGVSDLTDSSRQSIYAIKDTLGSTGYGDPRAATNSFVQQVLTDDTCPAASTFCTPGRVVRTGTSNAVNMSTDDGWFVDLPATRERANTDPQLTLGTLVFTTNVLDPSACTVDGYSFINFFDYRTGAPISSTPNIVSLRSDYLSSRPDVACTAAGTCKVYIQPANGEPPKEEPLPLNKPSGATRRTSWRELSTE
ncbi:Type IV pilus biogenesis factor PilY1 [Rhodocyclaceae bacterium]|nr:Type IV pilus biogenesis factor PilY1 [Rhodocyclaceae bacterium]